MRKLVEETPRIGIHAVYRAGALLAGSNSRWTWAGRDVEIRAFATRVEFVIDGCGPVEVGIVWHNGTTGGEWPSAKCRCGRGTYWLYPVGNNALGCRRCAGVSWATIMRWQPARWQAQRERSKLGPRHNGGRALSYKRRAEKVAAYELRALVGLASELRRKGRHGKRQRAR